MPDTSPVVSVAKSVGNGEEKKAMRAGNEYERPRHSRMPIRSVVLISQGPLSWTSEVENISATGVLVLRPAGWHGAPGDTCVLDLLLGEELHINLEACVVRLSADHIGFEYTRIPENKEAELWSLLGRHADDVAG